MKSDLLQNKSYGTDYRQVGYRQRRGAGRRAERRYVASDPELVSAARSLLSLIKSLSQGEKHIQVAQGIQRLIWIRGVGKSNSDGC
jgi:hypothetical protein